MRSILLAALAFAAPAFAADAARIEIDGAILELSEVDFQLPSANPIAADLFERPEPAAQIFSVTCTPADNVTPKTACGSLKSVPGDFYAFRTASGWVIQEVAENAIVMEMRQVDGGAKKRMQLNATHLHDGDFLFRFDVTE